MDLGCWSTLRTLAGSGCRRRLLGRRLRVRARGVRAVPDVVHLGRGARVVKDTNLIERAWKLSRATAPAVVIRIVSCSKWLAGVLHRPEAVRQARSGPLHSVNVDK